jgi:hypothetical protein
MAATIWPSKCSYKKRHNTTQTLVVRITLLQHASAYLTKNSILKTLWEKRAWRKEHTHDSNLYMFQLPRLLAPSALIFRTSLSLAFGSFWCFYNMFHRLHSACNSSSLRHSRCVGLRLWGIYLRYVLDREVHLRGIHMSSSLRPLLPVFSRRAGLHLWGLHF